MGKANLVVHLTLPLPGQMTRVEFEADLLKDDKIEREEEVSKGLESTVLNTSPDEAAEGGAEEGDGGVLRAAAGEERRQGEDQQSAAAGHQPHGRQGEGQGRLRSRMYFPTSLKVQCLLHGRINILTI